ncbi:putative METHIONYL-TRNA SYNTHETASE, mitochondrial [Neurospora hispaniola]|uniref:Probable methionine--tRNA ligase, mitochondrial n=1 Tax=Neurospora hispaniola TaxID=588809 RepID=A0AAJ0IFB7_9PEZI|nr:putative METHIONYL-TRNA SYNTHETASE, mitochondrial [Neurospora hispaniola]
MDVLRTASARRTFKWQAAGILARTSWVCWSCRSQFVAPKAARRTLATSTTTTTPTTPDNKPFYVTTPIFYVNASPHVGHMYSMVLGDVLKRWQTLKGNQAILCTGTDEHGTKVQRAAIANDMDPKQFCDLNSAKFQELAAACRIDYDRFMRTTDQDHVEAVKHFWLLLKEKGLIYEAKHEGWYCVSDECFYPESQLEKRQDPFTGEVYVASIESGNKVEWIEEKNYHFRMTALKDQLLEFYKNNPDWIVPQTRMNQVVDWVTNNLEDLSISRPVSRLSWGIRVPDDETQTIYVWVDALINYITMAGYPYWPPGREHLGGWPVDVHVIGKDILRFHCIYWPALLLALDLPLPKRILSHAHWTMEKKKMSKSIGNVVNPFYAMERFGIDTMRFYMIHNGGIANDADYSNDWLTVEYKKHLQNGVGNLSARVTRPKQWSLRRAVQSYQDGTMLLQSTGEPINDSCVEHITRLDKLASTVDNEMLQLNPSHALQKIMGLIGETNAFISNAEPWVVVKKQDSEALVDRIILTAGESLRIAGILLQPFMPDKAAQLLDLLGVENHNRTFHHARPLVDATYGTAFRTFGKEGIFPPPILDDIKGMGPDTGGKKHSSGNKPSSGNKKPTA